MTQPSEAMANRPDRIETGLRLADRYEVREVVGYGGMSTVYHGIDSVLDRDVAIKVLNQRLAANDPDRPAFLREARAAASLSHPRIVSTYDAGVYSGWPFIVMEYVSGGSLKDVIDAQAPLPPADAAAIAAALAEALQYGHDRGIVHCDIKPQNVLLDQAGNPKLVDFGISQTVAATIALTSAVTGTAGYVAPEQLEGQSLDGRADVYSLGTVLYLMLTGTLPFEAPNLAALATRRLIADPRPIRELNPAVPPALAGIVMRAIARQRDDRLTAGEMAAALRASLRDDGEAATMPMRPVVPPVEPTQLWRRTELESEPAAGAIIVDRRRPVRFWPLALLLAVLLAALIVALVVILPSRSGSSRSAVVPAVVSTRLDEAARQLQERGLKVSIMPVDSDKPVGTVLDQNPGADATQSVSNPVILTVSRGRQP